MIQYAVHFENDPARHHVGERYLADHLAYLERCGESVVAAGVLSREGSDAAVGGLWLVSASSELEVRELVEGDPLFQHGLRRTVRIWRYHPAATGG